MMNIFSILPGPHDVAFGAPVTFGFLIAPIFGLSIFHFLDRFVDVTKNTSRPRDGEERPEDPNGTNASKPSA
jgi:hypothetical protein